MVKIFHQDCRKKNNQGKVLNDIALSFGNSGQPLQSISKLEMALPLAENNMAKATGHNNLAVEYINVGDFLNAEINLNAAIMISKENNYKY